MCQRVGIEQSGLEALKGGGWHQVGGSGLSVKNLRSRARVWMELGRLGS